MCTQGGWQRKTSHHASVLISAATHRNAYPLPHPSTPCVKVSASSDACYILLSIFQLNLMIQLRSLLVQVMHRLMQTKTPENVILQRQEILHQVVTP
jgi:hypothetical protein